jgi:hypothetical protein
VDRNLWNIDSKTGFLKKSQEVIEYIKLLQYKQSWNNNQKKLFDDIIKQALQASNTNESLEIIGYRYNQQPKIYNDIDMSK